MQKTHESTSYRLREDIAERVTRKRLLRRLAPVGMLAPVVAIAAPLLSQTPDEGLPSLVPAVVTLGTTALIVFIVYRRTLARELEMWRSYRLSLSPNDVRRVVAGVAPVEVLRSEVTRIVAVPEQGIYVNTADPLRFVFIPEHLEQFQDVVTELGQWATIQPQDRTKARLTQGLGVLAGLALVGAWLASAWTSDPRAFAASIFVLYASIAYSGWSALRDPNLPMRRKATLLVVFGLLAIGPLARWVLIQAAGSP